MIIPLPNPLFPDDYSTVILDKNNQILRAFLNQEEQWCLPPDPNLEIPQKLETAVLLFEDQYFYYHPGFNPPAMARAFYQNIKNRKRVSGASTITMQVARLIEPKKRSYFNKIVEALQALKIEWRYSKKEILNTYLNHAPYGGNIIGYQAAALRYYQKLPEQLTWSEAATLAVLPNAPSLISPDKNPDLLLKKRNNLLKRLFVSRDLSKEDYQLAVLEPLPKRSQPFKIRAAHLARKLKQEHGKNGGLIQTTIDGKYQSQIANLAARHISYLKHLGIKNTAVLVTETKSGNVIAYVGSQGFFDAEGQGQVDGIVAPRSTGSTLKPFLYALSIDDGILLPKTQMKDVPTFYGAFSPSNSDEKYNGIVTAKEALIRSLNVPAVRLLFTYGTYPFYLFLKSSGMSTLFRSADDYGLPLILGGAETTVWDLAILFRGLGNQGSFYPLNVLKSQGNQAPLAVHAISPMASYLTLNMLKSLKRPGAEFYWEQYQNKFPLAWKTGTSYGQRDAWAVGVSPEWTIAVWVGNFDGKGNANLGGAKCAGPLLFDVFNQLPKKASNAWFKKPMEDQKEVLVCLDSGFLSSDACPNTNFVDAPAHAKPLRICPYHETFFMDNNTSHQVCSLCWKAGEYHAENRLIYPPDVVQYLRERGQSIGNAPLHNPNCAARTGNHPLEIVYPQANAHIWVPRDFGGVVQKVTFRVAHREKKQTLFWYLDNHYLGSTAEKHEKPTILTKGWHILKVVDGAGFRDQTRFFVDAR